MLPYIALFVDIKGKPISSVISFLKTSAPNIHPSPQKSKVSCPMDSLGVSSVFGMIFNKAWI